VSARTGIHAEPTIDNDLASDDSVSSVTVLDPNDNDNDTDTSAAPRDDADTAASAASRPVVAQRRIGWSRVLAISVLPAMALLLAIVAGYFKWTGETALKSESARVAAVREATASTVAILSYKANSVDQDLDHARAQLTGAFKDAYTSLIHDVVIPGAKQKQISAVATVPAAGAVSATADHAVVLLFVDQTVKVGNDAPTDTASVVRVTLDRRGGRWLISQFDPI
jgi:Mce-associated membrane protein